ncbi:HdeD family acid-resistance protein [Streptococcus cameli]
MKKVNQATATLWGILLIVFGGLFCLFQARFAIFLFWMLAFVFFINTCYRLYRRWKQQEGEVQERWVTIVFHLILSLFFLNNALLPTGLLAIFVAFEFIMIGLILLTDIFLQKRNHYTISRTVYVDGLVHLAVGLTMLFHLKKALDFIYLFLGFSLMWRGIVYLIDHRSNAKDRPILKNSRGRRKRLGLPIFLSALVPVGALRAINDLLSPDESRPVFLEGESVNTETPDLEVWIHTARKGFEMMGHVDISYKGKTYGYGQYDVDRQYLLGMIGDGVLYRIDSEDYLDSLARDDWRAVVGYGMVLTDAQKEAVERKIEELMTLTVPFELTSESQKLSYLGHLHEQYGVESYKFTQSKFKTYFVMTTNCVLLADTILEAIGTDNVANHGILTPGIYQEYFEREYQKPNSRICSKFVQGKQET